MKMRLQGLLLATCCIVYTAAYDYVVIGGGTG